MDGLEAVKEIAKQMGGTIGEVGRLPDGSGFARMSMPLRKDHWIYGDPACERVVQHDIGGTAGISVPDDAAIPHGEGPAYSTFEPPPMVFRMGAHDAAEIRISHRAGAYKPGRELDFSVDRDRVYYQTKQEFEEKIRRAGKYAVRAATMKGKEMDFDPDALLQNLVTAFLGYATEDGLSHLDEWANPETK